MALIMQKSLKEKLFNLDDEKLKPYFELDKVIEGVFTVAEKLYGLRFEEVRITLRNTTRM